MQKNKVHLKIFLSFIFLSAALQNALAQNSEEKFNTQLASDSDSSIKNSDQEHQLTIDKVDPSRFSSIAVIQALNKITAKTSLIEVKVGNTIKLGKLTVTVHKCWQSSLEQKPESKVLLEIFDENSKNHDQENQNKSRIFYGWMFSSSPSISALEHPIYDVTLVACKNK
ncbi:MAG: DUF2155 domain-containing protein [Proteobacteria bacterium]|nr:DUF2155 domain-containing protein [Pseudomonadota bacterium]